ncbi:MAG: HD domain-containing protein [Ilumatobacteraceae bacterium]|jgi:(p)ppGpp synthase/HD superfamily hydrolase|nr:HD domain-containing protein [Ilumatobacteraceae bacterium]
MTPRYTQALTLAATAHQGQKRKGTSIPYISHPVAVAALVASYGGDEDQQIAALLHDVLEDAGESWTPRIAEFGPRVLAIVRACTDGTPDATGGKAPWRERKEAYLAHLASTPDDALLVSACDKLHNIQSIAHDLGNIGIAVFGRFNASQDQVLWYYTQLAEIFTTRQVAPAVAINRTCQQIGAILTAGGTSCRGNM